MTTNQSAIGILRSALEIFGVVFLRFRPILRVWGVWLVAVNAAGIAFIGHIEAQVTLAVVGVAVLGQALIYQRQRFIRLLGVTHFLWVPMLIWIALRLGAVPESEHAFRAWLIALIVTNATSLVVDGWDAVRFARGERKPYYAW